MALLLLSFAAFVALGLPDGALGVAWPSMRDTFDQPVSSLGVLIVAITIGYLAFTALNGYLSERVGTGRLLVLAAAAWVVGIATYAFSPQWEAVVLATVLVGAASGVVDAELNAHVAVHHGVRAMGFLHAFFGVGATVAPAIMTGVLTAGLSWRRGYLVILAAEVLLLVAFFASRNRWGRQQPRPDAVTAGSARPNAILVATLALFFVYTGLEISAGQWAFTFLTVERELSTGLAGFTVAAYWGSLTVGRVLLGFLGDRDRPVTLLAGATSGALLATALLWWHPVELAAPVALVVLGLCLAAVFPTLVSLTPVRLGERRASAVIGYQLAAGGLGGGAIPALAGVVAGASVAALAPFLVVVAAAMVTLNLMTSRLA